jgi:hypothetical protein
MLREKASNTEKREITAHIHTGGAKEIAKTADWGG